jgi:hypothetical protein
MSGQDLAVIISASTAGVALLITTIVSAYNSVRANKLSAETSDKVDAVHTIINSQHDDLVSKLDNQTGRADAAQESLRRERNR